MRSFFIVTEVVATATTWTYVCHSLGEAREVQKKRAAMRRASTSVLYDRKTRSYQFDWDEYVGDYLGLIYVRLSEGSEIQTVDG